ncbi:MAG: hypothetical protein IJ629_04270 [Clostridia bacterium]|nr:hypothetical protein [Clostridia bacterium]
MDDKEIKVVVDYARGYYSIIGVYNGEVHSINKPINGVDNDGYYKDNFSRNLLRRRRTQIFRRLRRLNKKDESFQYDKGMITKVDPMLFKLLEDWDKMAGTNYSNEYLKIMTQKIERNAGGTEPTDFYKKRVQRIRMTNFFESGIRVSYNVGLLNANKSLSIFDRIRGIRFARAQRELAGADYHSSLRVKKDYYLQDMSDFVSTLKGSRRERRSTLRRSSRPREEALAEYEAEKNYRRVQSEVQQELATEVQGHMRAKTGEEQPAVGRTEPVHPARTPVRRSGIPEFLKKYSAERASGTEEGVLAIEAEEAAKRQKENGTEVVAEEQPVVKKPAHKRTIKQQHAPKSNSKKAKHYRETDKKKRVKNHIGVRPGPTKKQRESMARKEKKAQNSHYLTQMRLIEEREERRKRAEAGMAIKKMAARKAEKPVPTMSAAPEVAEILVPASPEEAGKVKRSIEGVKKPGEMVHISKGGRLTRRIQAEVRHWKRKVREAKESIKNKKFKPHLGEKGKKAVIVGAISLLAVGIVATGIKVSDLMRGSSNPTGVVRMADDEHNEEESSSIQQNEDGSYTAIIVPDETETETETEIETESATDAIIEGTEAVESNEIEETVPEETEAETTIAQEETVPLEIQTPADVQDDTPASTGVVTEEKTDEEKIAEFKETALNAYRDAIVIGETPMIGDLFADQTYSENPDGTGRRGSFASHPDYAISHINIVTAEGWHTVRVDGRNLSELLAEYPDYITYNFHVVNSKTGGWLGFVTQSQYEQLVQNKVNQIIESRTTSNLELEGFDR